jgi:predicted outer membrane repeat protein
MKKNTVVRQLARLGAALTLLGFGIAQAAVLVQNTYTVTTTNDDASPAACTGTAPNFNCATLRDAIAAANATDVSATIDFSPSISGGTITLGSILPVVTARTLLIDGTGRDITISGHGLYQIMNIGNSSAVTLNALTIANGKCVTETSNCTYASGGAIYMYGYGDPGSLTITNSTFYGNSATNGGAIFTDSQLTITNSTFYGNSAGFGGAIYQDNSTLTVTNGTFSNNTATGAGQGGAILNAGSATLYNTILAGGGTNGNCSGPETEFGYSITDGGGNLSDDAYCGFSPSGNNSVTNLNLGPLASNSGPTETIALLPGSAAISSGTAVYDYSDPYLCSLPVGPPAYGAGGLDQRGVARPPGPTPYCSSGAFQYGTVQTSGSGTAAGCTAPAICNITGGEAQTLTGTPSAIKALEALGSAGTITENVCIVDPDPRAICPPGDPNSPYFTYTTLPVAGVCPNFNPGFGSTVIPDYFCGAFGKGPLGGAGQGTGLVVIQGIANGVNSIPGLLLLNEANPDAFFGFTPASSECSDTGIPLDGISTGWAPWSLSPVEGTIPEGNRIIELTDGCGSQKQTTSGLSLMLLGVTLNLANATQELGKSAPHNLPAVNLIHFAEFKYANLFAEVAEDPINLPNKVRLLEIITQSALFLAAGPADYGCAEDTLFEADRYVLNNAGHFLGVPARDPNSYGRTRARLLNLFFTVFTRIDGHPNPITGSSTYANLPYVLDANLTTSPPATCTRPYLGRDED